METRQIRSDNGYSLVELVAVIVIVGIIAAIAAKSLKTSVRITRSEETKQELDQLAWAIGGNPALISSGGVRTDYGYVGDVGSMPTNLDALVSSSFSTWKGPYIRDDFYDSANGSETEFKVDAWGQPYVYSGGPTVLSVGSGTSISRDIANSVDNLLYNTVSVVVTDLDNTPPGAVYRDSVRLILTYPNGTGGRTAVTVYPGADGFAKFDSVPIGIHVIEAVILSDNDTLRRKIDVNPGRSRHADIVHFADIWTCDTSGSGSGSEALGPMAAGMYSNLISNGCGSNWQCVDEVTADGDNTYVRGAGNNWRADSYAVEDHSLGSGTIDSVVCRIRCRSTGNNQRAQTLLVTHGTVYIGNVFNLDGVTSYTDFSQTYVTNPNTSAAWTWAEIDALEIGLRIRRNGRCTQVRMEVYFTS